MATEKGALAQAAVRRWSKRARTVVRYAGGAFVHVLVRMGCTHVPVVCRHGGDRRALVRAVRGGAADTMTASAWQSWRSEHAQTRITPRSACSRRPWRPQEWLFDMTTSPAFRSPTRACRPSTTTTRSLVASPIPDNLAAGRCNACTVDPGAALQAILVDGVAGIAARRARRRLPGELACPSRLALLEDLSCSSRRGRRPLRGSCRRGSVAHEQQLRVAQGLAASARATVSPGVGGDRGRTRARIEGVEERAESEARTVASVLEVTDANY